MECKHSTSVCTVCTASTAKIENAHIGSQQTRSRSASLVQRTLSVSPIMRSAHTSTHTHIITIYFPITREASNDRVHARIKHFANSLLAGCTVPPESDSLITISPVATVVRGRWSLEFRVRYLAYVSVASIFVLSHRSRGLVLSSRVSAFGLCARLVWSRKEAECITP